MPGISCHGMLEADTIAMFKRYLERHMKRQRLEGYRTYRQMGLVLIWHHDWHSHLGSKGLFLCCVFHFTFIVRISVSILSSSSNKTLLQTHFYLNLLVHPNCLASRFFLPVWNTVKFLFLNAKKMKQFYNALSNAVQANLHKALRGEINSFHTT